MPHASTYPALNQLLIESGRSLLQYVGECWPWASRETKDAEQKIEELVQIQRQHVLALGALLDEADWTVEKGTYPTEYTDLHYVALSYLLDQLIQNQKRLVQEAGRTLAACHSDPEAHELVSEIQSAQMRILDELESLAKTTALDSTKFTNNASA